MPVRGVSVSHGRWSSVPAWKRMASLPVVFVSDCDLDPLCMVMLAHYHPRYPLWLYTNRRTLALCLSELERESTKDQIIVYGFITLVMGLLVYSVAGAAIRDRLRAI